MICAFSLMLGVLVLINVIDGLVCNKGKVYGCLTENWMKVLFVREFLFASLFSVSDWVILCQQCALCIIPGPILKTVVKLSFSFRQQQRLTTLRQWQQPKINITRTWRRLVHSCICEDNMRVRSVCPRKWDLYHFINSTSFSWIWMTLTTLFWFCCCCCEAEYESVLVNLLGTAQVHYPRI